MFLWFTNDEYQTLLNNGAKTQGDGFGNHTPVVKLFTPDAQCTWLLTEIVPPEEGEEPQIAFGLCDIGIGLPEMGNVSLMELNTLRGNHSLPVEKDLYFVGKAELLVYANAARKAGKIVEDIESPL